MPATRRDPQLSRALALMLCAAGALLAAGCGGRDEPAVLEPVLDATQGGTKSIEIAGLGRYAYEDKPSASGPDAPVAVLVADANESGLSLRALASALAHTYRVITPDLRGRGNSAAAPCCEGLAEHRADLGALLDALSVRATLLVGTGDGARIAAELAASDSARIERLVMIAPPDPGADPAESERLRALEQATLVLGGADDLPGQAAQKASASALRHEVRVALESVGRSPASEAPEASAAVIMKFAAAPGTLHASAVFASRTRAQIDALSADGLQGLLLREITGEARCDVTLHSIEYQTRGAAGESTTARAGVAIPSGPDPACQSPRMLLWAHGTSADIDYDVLTSDEVFGGIALAVFAAHGYVVVAPDYTGYHGSWLDYHPYLHAQAQASDMIDAMQASRAMLAAAGQPAPERVYVTGYSQGGFVALATQRAIEQMALPGIELAAAFPMSGPYRMSFTLEQLVARDPGAGASRLFPFIIDSYQHAYGDLYSRPVDLYNPPYDQSAIGLFPGRLGSGGSIDSGLLPAALTQARGTPFLLQPAFVTAFLADPAHPVRVAAARNDLTDWTPRAPLALCGGGADPVVPFENTRIARDAFAARGVDVPVYDFDTGDSLPGGTTSTLYLGFRSLFLFGGNEDAYHVALAPFCARLARDFFASR